MGSSRELAAHDLAMCIAAFGFVAIIAVLAHPGGPKNGAATPSPPATEARTPVFNPA